MSRARRESRKSQPKFWTPPAVATVVVVMLIGIGALIWAMNGPVPPPRQNNVAIEDPIQSIRKELIAKAARAQPQKDVAVKAKPLPPIQSRYKELVARAARAVDSAKQAMNKKDWQGGLAALELMPPLLEAALREKNSEAENLQLRESLREQLYWSAYILGMQSEALLASFLQEPDGQAVLLEGFKVLERAKQATDRLKPLDEVRSESFTKNLAVIHTRFVKMANGKVVHAMDAARQAAKEKNWDKAIGDLEPKVLLLQAALREKNSEDEMVLLKDFLRKQFALKANILRENALEIYGKHPMEPEKARRDALLNGIKILKQAEEAASKIDPPDLILGLSIKNIIAGFYMAFCKDGPKMFLASYRRIVRDHRRVLEDDPDHPEAQEIKERIIEYGDGIKLFEGQLRVGRKLLLDVEKQLREKPELDPRGLLMDQVRKNLAVVAEVQESGPVLE